MTTDPTRPQVAQGGRFLSVAATAKKFGVSPMTLYRLINEGGFPAVRIRTRLVIPEEAIEQMRAAALAAQAIVDPADWVDSASAS